MGFMLPAGMDALPTLSDGFWGQNSGLPSYGMSYGSPSDLISQHSTRSMSSLLILLG